MGLVADWMRGTVKWLEQKTIETRTVAPAVDASPLRSRSSSTATTISIRLMINRDLLNPGFIPCGPPGIDRVHSVLNLPPNAPGLA